MHSNDPRFAHLLFLDRALFAGALPEKGPLVALDVSKTKIGLAVSDPAWRVASPLQVIVRTCWRQDIDLLAALFQQHSAAGFVVGWPLHMNGDAGRRCQGVRQVAENILSVCPKPCLLWDERLSSVSAQELVDSLGQKKKKRAEHTDHIAASYILESALEALRFDRQSLAASASFKGHERASGSAGL